MRTEPDNCTPRLLPPARSGEGQYCAILASLQAVRARCAAGAAPGPRLRVPHAPNTPETTKKTVTTTTNPALTSSAAASGMTPETSAAPGAGSAGRLGACPGRARRAGAYAGQRSG